MRTIRNGRLANLAILSLAGLAACSSGPLRPEPGDEIFIDIGGRVDDWPADAWGLQGARVTEGRLELTVQYSGGCAEHQFWLVAIGDWNPLPNQGPVPWFTMPILLAHDAHGDPCDALFTRELSFDLEPLRAAYHRDLGYGPATIFLRVPMGQGSADSVSVPLDVPATFPPD